MKADKVEVTFDDDNCMMGAKFSSQENIAQYWLFGKSEDPAGADEPIYIEKDDQIWSTYDGVKECILCQNSIRLRLDAVAASELHTKQEVLIEFSVSDRKYALLRQAFISMFRNHPGYSERV